MKKQIPIFQTDKQAEAFVANSDPSEFELKPKDKSINLRGRLLGVH